MKQLTSLRLSDLWKEVKSQEALWGDLKLETKEYLKMLLQNILREEQTHYLACARYERHEDRVDFRNGYYARDIESSMGLIKDIKVPRNRITSYESILFKKYKRKEISLIQLIKDAFLSGLSTRKVGEVFETILGYKISPTTVSNIVKSLDGKVRAYHRKNIEDRYAYLFLDGITLKIKSLSNRNKKVILVAYGITASGIKEIIAFKIASSESEIEWYMFVDSLYRRGLAGKNLNLVIIDGAPALALAAGTVYPFCPIQRCWVHKLRNVASKLPKKGADSCLGAAKKIYQAASRQDASAIYKNWVATYSDKYPKAVACLGRDIDSLLTFFDFGQPVRIKIRTTNIIERSFREVRRRTRPIGCFENDSSVNRIIFGVISGLNKNWESKPLKEITQLT